MYIIKKKKINNLKFHFNKKLAKIKANCNNNRNFHFISLGSAVTLDAMVFWRIVDSLVAAKNAMEILVIDENLSNDHKNKHSDQDHHIRQASANINYLRQTVLRIVKHHLTAQVGECTLASDYSLGAMIKKQVDPETKRALPEHNLPPNQAERDLPPLGDAAEQERKKFSFDMLNYLQSKQKQVLGDINRELNKIGVLVQNLCIYSVTPSVDIQKELDRQTKARVDANTALIEANALRNKSEILTRTFI